MIKTAKPINKFMFLFMAHSVFVTLLFSYLIDFTGVNYDPFMGRLFAFLLVFVPPTVLYITNTKSIKDAFYTSPLGLINSILVILIVLLAFPALLLISEISSLILPDRLTGPGFVSYLAVPFWAYLLSSAVLPAFFEETIFRGVVFNKQYDLPIGKKVLLSGLFFAMMHLNPVMFLHAFAGGALFACLMLITRSITAPILAHFTLNAFITWINWTNREAIEQSVNTASVASAVNTLLYLLFLTALTFPVLTFSVYLLVINNKEKIAIEALLIKLKEVLEKQKVLAQMAANGGADNPQDIPIVEQADIPPVKKQIFTWEFWGVVCVYIAYIAFVYFII